MDQESSDPMNLDLNSNQDGEDGGDDGNGSGDGGDNSSGGGGSSPGGGNSPSGLNKVISSSPRCSYRNRKWSKWIRIWRWIWKRNSGFRLRLI